MYLDLDVHAKQSMEELKQIVDTRMPEQGLCVIQEVILINNWFIACNRDSTFAHELLLEIENRLLGRVKPLLGNIGPDFRTLAVTGPFLYRDMLMHPEHGAKATVLYLSEMHPIVEHDSLKEWSSTGDTGNHTPMDYILWGANGLDRSAF